MSRQVTLAITHFNRFDFLLEAIAQVQSDSRIREIVIVDDASTDGSWEKLVGRFDDDDNVLLSRNAQNLDCYRNKKEAVERAPSDWVILFDSDNVMSPDYLDALFHIMPWDSQTAYLPVQAEPLFDYRAFAGETIDKHNVARYVDRPHFLTALNTANYFFNRNEYSRVWDGQVDPHTADSLWQNYNWLKDGNRIHFVPGMHYFHRVHAGSHYKTECHKTGNIAKQIEQKLRDMK
jgi:glycosyltransferase involved in cell wall biosynthesis